MNPKHVAGTALLLLALTGLYVAGTRMAEGRASSGERPAAPQQEAKPGVDAIVYYFHTNKRCATCERIESLTRRTMEEDFADDLASGKLLFRVRNLDEAANEHFRSDFLLDYGTVVVASGREEDRGRYESLDRVWQLHGDEKEFRGYLREHVADFLPRRRE